jgi:WD40 repeat protein
VSEPAVSHASSLARLWDLKVRKRTVLADGFALPVLSPDGGLVAATVSGAGKQTTLQLWDARTGQAGRTICETRDARLGRPWFSHDGRLVAATKDNQEDGRPEIWVWDVKTGRRISTLACTEKGNLWYYLEFSPDDKLLAVTQHETDRVYVFDVPTGEALTVLKVAKNAGLRGPVFSPDSHRLAVAAQVVPEEFKQELDVNPADVPQPRIFLVALAAGSEPESIVCPHGTVGDLAFSPDGKLIALGSYGCVWLFDATTAPAGK